MRLHAYEYGVITSTIQGELNSYYFRIKFRLVFNFQNQADKHPYKNE